MSSALFYPAPLTDRVWPTRGPKFVLSWEEAANSLTHGFGLALSVAGAYTILGVVSATHDVGRLIGCLVYAATLVALYAGSTTYHSVVDPQAKLRWQRIDHACIYLLIAGTYTPFLTTHLYDHGGQTLLAVVWTLAVGGVLFKTVCGIGRPLASVVSYLAQGWTALLGVRPMLEHIPAGALAWLLAGGLAYTLGLIFYRRDNQPFNHAIWHLFVLVGSVCHFYAVLWYVAL